MDLRMLSCIKENGGREYFAYDRSSGYPYWTTSIQDAYLFGPHVGDGERLAKEVNEIIRGPDSVMSDGTRYPNRMLQMATGVNRDKSEGRTVIEVLSLRTVTESSTIVAGRIVKPTGFKYD